MSNTGVDSSHGVGGNVIGNVTNSNVGFGGSFTAGDNASISVSNAGTYTGTNSSSGNSVGLIGNPLFTISGSFQAGNSFSLSGTNIGIDHGSGNNNTVGLVNDPQLEFGTFTVGDNATISVMNSGINSNTSTGGTTGVVSGEQFGAGDFTAGKNLTITATNNATNSGNSTNVGVIEGDQVSFFGTATMDDGAFITAFNNGTGVVGGSQINFQQGFVITSGSATFQAFNDGTIGNFGIFVGGGSGGDAKIVLGNSSLNVNTGSSTFTIGQLVGDATSTVQVLTDQTISQLIIDTDSFVTADFAGSIQNFQSATSGLVKTGLGTQILSGTNTYTGLTEIQNGTLVVNGSIASALTIDANGVLKGTGSIAGPVVNLGNISPGQSIGTITFLSTFTNNGGNYNVEVNGAGQSDLIDVSGLATLNGGAVIVSSADGTFALQKRYTILTAGSISGTFAGTSATTPLIRPVLSYDANDVFLTLFSNTVAAARTNNQRAVATQLDNILDPNALESALISQIADLSLADAGEALDTLSGYQHTADLITTQLMNRQFIRRLYDPLRRIVTTEPTCECDPCCSAEECDLSVWFDAEGSFVQVRKDENAARKFHSDGYSLTGGIQKTFCECTLGLASGYEYDKLRFSHSDGREKCRTWLVGLYGLYRPSCYYGLVDLTYSRSSNRLYRSINIGTIHDTAKSEPVTEQYTFYGEVGLDVDICSALVQPFFGLETESFKRNHLREDFASGAELVVDRRHRHLTSTRLGMHLSSASLFQNCFNVSVDLAWDCLVSDKDNTIRERFEEFGTGFDIEGIKLNRNGFDYAVTVSSEFRRNWTGYVKASGETWNRANIFDILAGVQFCW